MNLNEPMEKFMGRLEESRKLPLPDDPLRVIDTGNRTQFPTGAVRDIGDGKGIPCEIPPIALMRLARHFEAGAKKYGIGNFRKGIPLASLFNSAFRHLLAASEGRTDEDHLAAALWNVAVWIWTDHEIQNGRLPKTLENLPYARSGVDAEKEENWP